MTIRIYNSKYNNYIIQLKIYNLNIQKKVTASFKEQDIKKYIVHLTTLKITSPGNESTISKKESPTFGSLAVSSIRCKQNSSQDIWPVLP